MFITSVQRALALSTTDDNYVYFVDRFILSESFTEYNVICHFFFSEITCVCGYNQGEPSTGPTVTRSLVLSSLECPQWPLLLVVPPPHAHDPPDMHTSLLLSHPGVGQQQELTQIKTTN